MRSERNNRVPHPHRQEKSENSANQRDDKALDQEFANNLAAGRADCRLNRKFPRTRGTARRKKVRQIRARNEKDQSHRAEKQSEIISIFTDQIFEQWRDRNARARVSGRIFFFQPRRDPFQLRPRLIDSHAGFQAAPNKQHWVNRAVLPKRDDPPGEGKPKISVLRRRHFRRHYPDHGETLIIELHRTTDHIAVAIERALPKPIADHDYRRATRLCFLIRESASQLRRDPNHLEKLFRDMGTGNSLRLLSFTTAAWPRRSACRGAGTRGRS